MLLRTGDYSWNLDGEDSFRGFARNVAIGVVGSLPSSHVRGPGNSAVLRSSGVAVPIEFNRTYSFRAWGTIPQ